MAKILSDGIKRWKSDIIDSIKIFVLGNLTVSVILAILFLLSGIYLTYLAINEQNLWDLAISIFFFILFIGIAYLHKKFWFGLAIVLFLVAGLIVYNMIWEELNKSDSPIFLTSGCVVYNGETPIQIPYDIERFFEIVNITNVSLEKIRDLKSIKDLNWTANCSIICRSEGKFFEESKGIICNTQINVDWNISASGDYKYIKENYEEYIQQGYNKSLLNAFAHMSGILYKCQYTNGSYQEDCSTSVYRIGGPFGYPKEFKIPTPVQEPGKYFLNLSFLYSIDYRLEPDIFQEDEDVFIIRYTGDFYVKSKEEISQKERERNYQLIIALFAIFGIFPAIYHLRNLWRNEK